jgi:hypothetical protein
MSLKDLQSHQHFWKEQNDMINKVFRVILGLAIVCLLSGPVVAQDYATPADESAMRELREKNWVRDLYVSPGHMNVGVYREEKDWNSPMIGKWVCTVLAQHGSKLTWVRFVDIRAVVYQGKSPRGAEISKLACKE